MCLVKSHNSEADVIVHYADAAAAAAVVPAETAALPGGSAAQREVFKKSQQKQREAAVWRQTASCICANYALYWRREGAEFPVAPTAGNIVAAVHVGAASSMQQFFCELGFTCSFDHDRMRLSCCRVGANAPGCCGRSGPAP